MHLVFLKCCVIIPTGFITQLRRVKKKWQSRVNFGPPAQNTPPPKPLSWPPTLMKRVSICLEFKHLSACIILMPNNAIPDELQGKNWFVHAFALTTCYLESIAGNLPEITPTAYLGTFHAILWPGTQIPPLLSNHPTRVLNDWAWALRIPKLYLTFRESVLVWFWSIPPKLADPPWTPPPPDPLWIDSFLYQSMALDVRIPNI